jgi:hypothetical protein
MLYGCLGLAFFEGFKGIMIIVALGMNEVAKIMICKLFSFGSLNLFKSFLLFSNNKTLIFLFYWHN